MKRILLTFGAAGLLAAPLYAGPVGLLEGQRGLQVVRGEESFAVNSSSPLLVNELDVVRTRANPARVNASNGETYVAGPESNILIEEGGAIRLERGAVVASLVAGSSTVVKHKNLELSLITPRDEAPEGGTNIIVREVETNRIEVVTVGSQSTAVYDVDRDTQIATLGTDDMMVFGQLPNGEWVPSAPGVFQQQELDPVTADLEEDELEAERRRGAFWWLGTTGGTIAAVGVGAAAVGVGGYIFYNEVIDDDDDPDPVVEPVRRPITPIRRPSPTPTPTPYPTPDNGWDNGEEPLL